MSAVGRGLDVGYLEAAELRRIVREGLAGVPLDGKRVIVLIPDGTRTMPMPAMFDMCEENVERFADSD